MWRFAVRGRSERLVNYFSVFSDNGSLMVANLPAYYSIPLLRNRLMNGTFVTKCAEEIH